MFVSALAHSPVHRAIVQGVVAIARQTNLTTVAEDAATAHTLAALGADLLQGYHFARPQPPKYRQSQAMPGVPHFTAV